MRRFLIIIVTGISVNFSFAQGGISNSSAEVPEKEKIGSINDAIKLIENQKEYEGIQVVNYLLRSKPDSTSFLYYLKAMAFYKMQHFQASMNTIDRSVSVDKTNYRSLALKGDIFQKLSQLDSALVYYEMAQKASQTTPTY